MTIQEVTALAQQARRAQGPEKWFRREGWETKLTVDGCDSYIDGDDDLFELDAEDVLATDWEVVSDVKYPRYFRSNISTAFYAVFENEDDGWWVNKAGSRKRTVLSISHFVNLGEITREEALALANPPGQAQPGYPRYFIAHSGIIRFNGPDAGQGTWLRVDGTEHSSSSFPIEVFSSAGSTGCEISAAAAETLFTLVRQQQKSTLPVMPAALRQLIELVDTSDEWIIGGKQYIRLHCYPSHLAGLFREVQEHYKCQ